MVLCFGCQPIRLLKHRKGSLYFLPRARAVRCAASVDTSGGRGDSALSRLRLYNLEPGVYPVYVAGSGAADVALTVTYTDAAPEAAAPSNETCGTASELMSGESQTLSLVGATQDLISSCATSGELVYTFKLDQAQDVRIFASPLDRYGVPQLSLRREHCNQPEDELTCRIGAPSASLFVRNLPAGRYYLSVSGSGPCDVDLRLEESNPTPSAGDETPAPGD